MIHPTIKAILFDKDGTVLDFLHTWYPIFRRFVHHVAKSADLSADEERALGHELGDREGNLSDDSVFAHGGFQDILGRVRLHAPKVELGDLKRAYDGAMTGVEITARPIGNAKQTLAVLRSRGYIIGLATADRRENTLHTLKEAGLDTSFDFLGTDDSVARGKPYPDLMDLFCQTYSLTPNQVAMVGDTRRDMEFAKNAKAGQAIFVQSSFPDRVSEGMADLVIPSVDSLSQKSE